MLNNSHHENNPSPPPPTECDKYITDILHTIADHGGLVTAPAGGVPDGPVVAPPVSLLPQRSNILDRCRTPADVPLSVTAEVDVSLSALIWDSCPLLSGDGVVVGTPGVLTGIPGVVAGVPDAVCDVGTVGWPPSAVAVPCDVGAEWRVGLVVGLSVLRMDGCLMVCTLFLSASCMDACLVTCAGCALSAFLATWKSLSRSATLVFSSSAVSYKSTKNSVQSYGERFSLVTLTLCVYQPPLICSQFMSSTDTETQMNRHTLLCLMTISLNNP